MLGFWKKAMYWMLAALIYINIGYALGVHYYGINILISQNEPYCRMNVLGGWVGLSVSPSERQEIILNCRHAAVSDFMKSKHQSWKPPLTMPEKHSDLKAWAIFWPIPMGEWLFINTSNYHPFSLLEKIWGPV